MSHRCNRHFWDRREFLFQSGGGISGLALAYLLDRDGLLAAAHAAPATPARRAAVGVNPYAPKPPHFKPRATAVISLFMSGGWSQVDTFDPKPALDEVRRPADRRQGQGRRHRAAGVSRAADAEPVRVQEVRAERHRGVGDVPAPQPARRRDRVPALGLRAVERSRAGHLRDADRADQPRASRASARGSPTAWARIASSLPAFVVMTDARGGPLGGPNDWSAGFMPAAYQGTLFRSTGDPIVDLEAAGRRDRRGPARAARRAGEAERARHAEVPGQQRAGGADLVVRARLPDAGLRAERGRRRQRVGGDARSCTASTTRSPSRSAGSA